MQSLTSAASLLPIVPLGMLRAAHSSQTMASSFVGNSGTRRGTQRMDGSTWDRITLRRELGAGSSVRKEPLSACGFITGSSSYSSWSHDQVGGANHQLLRPCLSDCPSLLLT